MCLVYAGLRIAGIPGFSSNLQSRGSRQQAGILYMCAWGVARTSNYKRNRMMGARRNPCWRSRICEYASTIWQWLKEWETRQTVETISREGAQDRCYSSKRLNAVSSSGLAAHQDFIQLSLGQLPPTNFTALQAVFNLVALCSPLCSARRQSSSSLLPVPHPQRTSPGP